MSRLSSLSYLAAPALLLGYGVARLIDGLDGTHGPGPAWTVGHLLFLASLVMFGFVLYDLARTVGASGRRARQFGLGTLVAAGLGLTAFTGTVLVDLWVGLHASDRAGMNALYDRYDTPALIPALGPLFQLGLLVLLVQSVVVRRVPWWSPVAALLACVAITVDLDLLPLGALLFSIALAPFAALAASAPIGSAADPAQEASLR
jgi:hypothetical protein